MSAKLEQFQGIRALAIMGVFMVHTSVWLAEDLGCIVSVIGRYGGSAVITFFLLSGFLMAYKRKTVPNPRGEALIKKAWSKVNKMYGLFLLTMLVAFLSKCPSTAKGWVQAIVCVPFQLTLTQSFVPIIWITHAFNGPAWFLSSLFGVWILVFLCHNGINKLLNFSVSKSVVFAGVILVMQSIWLIFAHNIILPVFAKNYYLKWCNDWLIYSNPFLCFSEYCFGLLLGQICMKKQFPVFVQNILALLVTCLVIIYMTMVAMHIRIQVPWIVIAECLVFLGFIAIMSPQSVGYRILSTSILVWFGNISGYLYLIHGAVNYALWATVADYVPKPWLFFIALAISILLSIFADNYYKSKKKSLE